MTYQDSITIRAIAQADAAQIYRQLKEISDLPLSHETPNRLNGGDVVLLTAGAIGFVLVNFKPRYYPFQKLKIPEIQGLTVHPDHRGQGVAKALMHEAESYVRDKGLGVIGLGVGLSSFYGPAQCLYASLGYRPDGNGLIYDGETIPQGKMVTNDDDLCLMMIKEL